MHPEAMQSYCGFLLAIKAHRVMFHIPFLYLFIVTFYCYCGTRDVR